MARYTVERLEQRGQCKAMGNLDRRGGLRMTSGWQLYKYLEHCALWIRSRDADDSTAGDEYRCTWSRKPGAKSAGHTDPLDAEIAFLTAR